MASYLIFRCRTFAKLFSILALTVDVVTIGTDALPQLYSQAVDAGLGHAAGHSRHSPGTSDLLTHTRHNHTLHYIPKLLTNLREVSQCPEKAPY